MSAIRHERRGSRAAQASPYSRPAKKSPWSLSNLLSFLNPLRFRSSSEELDSERSSERLSLSSDSTEGGDTNKTAELLYSNSQRDTTTHTHASRPADSSQDRLIQPPIAISSPPKRSALHLDDADDSSPAKNLEIVTKFLEERGGKPMSSVELEGVISLIRKSTPSEKSQPFRFSCSTSPTPGRDDSPDAMRGRSPIGNGNIQGPRKMLTKNPNGVYRWRGGGSARPARSRNRYISPAFGPPRVTPERLVLKESTATGEGVRADNKRRRIGDEVSFSIPDPSPSKSAMPLSGTLPSIASPKPGNGAGGQVKANGTPNGTSFRFRSSGLQKQTTPAVPSPLRQAWSGSSPDVSNSPMQMLPKPTKAANFMAELIKEVTPPKRPDVSNPYQTASPVKVCPPPSRPRPKRTRVTGKAGAPASSNTTSDAEAKGDESGLEKITPQAIIEATLPKGSKRARPPAHFEKSMATETATTSAEITGKGVCDERVSTPHSALKEARNKAIYTVEEVDEDEEAKERVTKKAKSYLNGDDTAPVERSAPPSVEEIKDVEMSYVNDKLPQSIGTVPMALSKNVFGHKPTSAPKEPSKLRYSYQPETAASSTPPASPPATPSIPVPTEARTAEVSTKQTVALTQDPKTTVLALSTSALPVFTFTFDAISTVTVSPDEKLAREQVISKVEASLPTFTFHPKPEVRSSVITVTATPAKTFDWSAIGIDPPAAISGNWTCSTCMLSNPASATVKCTVCETPR
ncbi:hypothetical protein APHAL10511_004399 [Amanita phalloides]|nr:hypothetical protein APHAL10511_004399 [Amanita phalloides]